MGIRHYLNSKRTLLPTSNIINLLYQYLSQVYLIMKMTEIENLSLSERLTIMTNKDEQQKLFKRIEETISDGYMTEEVLGATRNLIINPSLTVGTLIEMNLQEGILEREDGKVVFNRREEDGAGK